jgi:hypothetical protein
MKTEQKQQKYINLALVGIGLIGVVVSVLVYLDNKKHAKIKDDVATLDKEIKVLELAMKEKEAKIHGLI